MCVRTKHGHAKKPKSGGHTPTFVVWHAMKTRCLHQSSKHFPRYGGRGIRICDKWLEFSGFLEDMGERPAGLTLDRIDNNGNYEPGNCRWVSMKVQGRNRRTNVYLTFNNETLTIAEWAERVGLKSNTLVRRLRSGWTTEKALTTKLMSVYSH